MTKIDIEITETLSRVITVNAANEDAARYIVEDMYRNEEVVLGETDYKGYEVKVRT